MLRVVDTNVEGTGDVSVDEYVPLSFRADPSTRPNPIRWRIGDRQRNVFELKLDRTGGEVFGATLIVRDQAILQSNESPCSHLPIVPALPLVDISTITDDVVDAPAMFRLVRADGCLTVLFGVALAPTRCLSLARVRFLLDGDELVGVSFGPLTQREFDLIGA